MTRRTLRDEGERQIVASATAFFAKHGSKGQIRALASSLGITQSLAYASLPPKQALVDRPCKAMFVER